MTINKWPLNYQNMPLIPHLFYQCLMQMERSSAEGQTWEGGQVSNILIQNVQPKLSSDGLLISQIDLVQTVDLINWFDHISDTKLIEEQNKDSELKCKIDWLKKGNIPRPDELYPIRLAGVIG